MTQRSVKLPSRTAKPFGGVLKPKPFLKVIFEIVLFEEMIYNGGTENEIEVIGEEI